LGVRVHPDICELGRGVIGDPLSTTNSAVNCGEPKVIVRGVSRGLVVKLLRYKNIKLTLTTRQLHSRELFAAAAPTDVTTGTVDRRVGVVYVVNYIFSAHILVCFPPK
jgi:hypothetical protein